MSAINSDQWQWAPSYDLDGSDNMWLLYGENRFNGPKAPWRVDPVRRKHEHEAGARRDDVPVRLHLPGDVRLSVGVLEQGTRTATVWRMNVETDVKEKLTVPGNRDEHSIGVTADGTAYVVQDGDRVRHAQPRSSASTPTARRR